MNDILVSVIISSFNTPAAYLTAAVRSILEQTYQNIEVIVIDDCSSENKVEDVLDVFKNDSRLHIVNNEVNTGLAIALNRGLDIAKGKYIVRMDSDDISMKDRIERQVAYMESNQECDIMCGRTCLFDDDGTFWMGSSFYAKAERVKVELFFDSTLLHPGVIIRRSFLDKNNLCYDPECRRAQDYNLWVRSSLAGGNIRLIDQYHLFYRQHTNAASKSDRGRQLKVVLDIHKMFLTKLNIKVDEEVQTRHECFANPYDFKEYDAFEMFKWAERLIHENQKAKVFDNADFRYGVLKRYLGGVLLHIKDGSLAKASLTGVMLRLIIKPKYWITCVQILMDKRKQNKSANEHFKMYIEEEWKRAKEEYGL